MVIISKKKVNSLKMFLEQLLALDKKSKDEVYYRGQGKKSYKFQPSIFRKGNLKEHSIYTEVMTNCSSEFESCVLHIEKLSKMQHYGVPTRLLDVTSNALVALYFACESSENEDGVVFVINAKSSKIKQYDSDTISILSSLPRFNFEEKIEMKKLVKIYKKKIKGEKEKNLQLFNEENNIIRRLLHEIKKEKPAFENLINPDHLVNNYIIVPRKNNNRIIRQSGAFIIFGLKKSKEKDLINDFNCEKIYIKGKSKKKILDQLSSVGITKATMYPELYKVAEYIKGKYNID